MAEYNPNARDERESLLQQRGKAAEQFVDGIDWEVFNSLYKYHAEVLESHKRIQQSMGVSYDYGRQEAIAERRNQKEGIIKLMEDIRELAITHFNAPE